MTQKRSTKAVAGILRTYLSKGAVLQLDGLGSLRVLKNGDFEFRAQTEPRVFISYASEDRALAMKLSRQLRAAGFHPWLDREQLLPGENWPRAISRAIEASDFALLCFSSKSMSRRGYFHKELRLVLENAARVPIGDVFLLPVRFDPDCRLPEAVADQYQYVDLFPDWDEAVGSIVAVITKHRDRRS
jgi:hypothetical protein